MSCPMPTLRNLTHLALRKTRHLRTIDSVLEHCVRLESLWVDLSSGRSEGLALFRSLQAHPDALPHLTHLKLIIMFDAPGLSMDILAAFIAPKKHLRCLDWQDGHVTTAQLLPLLTVLPSLPALEVLGLHLFPRDNSMVEGMRAGALNAFIPERVTALRFRISYGRHTAPRGRCWEELWARVTNLGFLWMADNEYDPIAESHEFATAAKSLQILGHKGLFYDIEHANSEAVLSPPWSPTKSMFRSVEDFGNEDWEWLTRGHCCGIRYGLLFTF
ncbi:hypothetical protein FOMPIDRAFT_82835 [Fomitopsis schrenkii]|uniref:F-box domain-containing protein n=1 Tax=Fomitopsis schrenkii TaxID=2126942 RepID=S8EKY9_FOMSC|nr:hypothetical protein FOMPIDRAFT_82835 [Fomitopsis schrenkii]